MVELSTEEAVDMSMVLEEAIADEAAEIGGIDDDVRWASEAYRYHLEHVRGMREDRIAKYKDLLVKLGFPYDG